MDVERCNLECRSCGLQSSCTPDDLEPVFHTAPPQSIGHIDRFNTETGTDPCDKARKRERLTRRATFFCNPLRSLPSSSTCDVPALLVPSSTTGSEFRATKRSRQLLLHQHSFGRAETTHATRAKKGKRESSKTYLFQFVHHINVINSSTIGFPSSIERFAICSGV
jgi:hypothetical protein